MALVTPDQMGEILMLQYIVGLVNADNKVLHLYSNDLIPSDSTVIGDLTEVASGATGYEPITLLSSGWTVTQTGGVTSAVHSERTFTLSGELQAYGYYVTDQTNQLLWLERFAGAPYTLPESGGIISITPRLSLD